MSWLVALRGLFAFQLGVLSFLALFLPYYVGWGLLWSTLGSFGVILMPIALPVLCRLVLVATAFL